MIVSVTVTVEPFCYHKECDWSCYGSVTVLAEGDVDLDAGDVSGLKTEPDFGLSRLDIDRVLDALFSEAERLEMLCPGCEGGFGRSQKLCTNCILEETEFGAFI